MTKFITFEGTEGAGKSTLIQALAHALIKRGIQVTITREPGGNQVSEEIRTVILKNEMNPWTELFLYEASRAEHLNKTILPALQAGCWVLCDRYADSSLAYQGYARGLDLKTIKKLNQIATQNTVPNMTVFLDIDPKVGLNAATVKTRFENEGVVFQTKVRKGFLALAKQEPKRFLKMKARSGSPENMSLKLIKEFEKRKWLNNKK